MGGDLRLVGVLALAMGMRSAMVQRMGIGGISTTVLTMKLTTLASDVLLRGKTVATARGLGVAVALRQPQAAIHARVHP